MRTDALKVLERLGEIGCKIRPGPIDPFGNDLPFVIGVAWDESTAQLAVVAAAEEGEWMEEETEDGWRQLLFALSGLRNHLTRGHPAAFGAPLLFAVVDYDGARLLRKLAESLASDYAVFRRVDLNLVLATDIASSDALDLALAPLLPMCRKALEAVERGEAIGPEDLDAFWDVLQQKVAEVADEKLDARFARYNQHAAVEIVQELVGEVESLDDSRAPWPVDVLEFEQLRSFGAEKVRFGQATVISGTNGSGKTTVLEALELLWSRSTQRCPPGVKASEYERHVIRNGEGRFSVGGSGRDVPVDEVSDSPDCRLARSALTQEEAASLASASPKVRMQTLLGVTGLEVPELDVRTKEIFATCRQRLNNAFSRARMGQLKAGLTPSIPHLEAALTPNFSAKAPDWRALNTAEIALEQFTDTYRAMNWSQLKTVPSELAEIDDALALATADLTAPAAPSGRAKEVCAEFRAMSQKVQGRLPALLSLLKSLEPAAPARHLVDQEPPPIPRSLAAMWLAHADGISQAAEDFVDQSADLRDSAWRAALISYADNLKKAAQEAPRTRLRTIASSRPPATSTTPGSELPLDQLEAAGFSGVPTDLPPLRGLLEDLVSALRSYSSQLDGLAEEVEEHPAWVYALHHEQLLERISRYELARRLRMPDSPTTRASDELLRSLLEGRLAPALKELVAALVRFEWYFKPISINVEKGKIHVGGVAVDLPDRIFACF